MVQIGSAPFTYDARNDWEQMPAGMRLHETPGVAVSADDTVYLLTRNVDNPMVVFDREGNFLRTFGQGVFTNRAHAVRVASDGLLYCADDGSHTITKWTTDGKLRMTIGTPGKPSSGLAPVTIRALAFPPLTIGIMALAVSKIRSTSPESKACIAGALPL